MMQFFTSSADLVAWIEQKGPAEAIHSLSAVIGPRREETITEVVNKITTEKDASAGQAVFDLLAQLGIVEKMSQNIPKTAGGITYKVTPEGLELEASVDFRNKLVIQYKEDRQKFASAESAFHIFEPLIANSELQWMEPEWCNKPKNALVLGVFAEARPIKPEEQEAVDNGRICVAGKWQAPDMTKVATYVSPVQSHWVFNGETSPQEELLVNGKVLFASDETPKKKDCCGKCGGQCGGKCACNAGQDCGCRSAAVKPAMEKTATGMTQTVATLDLPMKICPKLPRSTGRLVSTLHCRERCLDSLVLDDDPTRVICAQALWLGNVMDKYSQEQIDPKTGSYIGGYIADRFHVIPEAGTPANPDVPRHHGNRLNLAPHERTRQPRPHEWSTERRLREREAAGSTKSLTLASAEQNTKTAARKESGQPFFVFLETTGEITIELHDNEDAVDFAYSTARTLQGNNIKRIGKGRIPEGKDIEATKAEILKMWNGKSVNVLDRRSSSTSPEAQVKAAQNNELDEIRKTAYLAGYTRAIGDIQSAMRHDENLDKMIKDKEAAGRGDEAFECETEAREEGAADARAKRPSRFPEDLSQEDQWSFEKQQWEESLGKTAAKTMDKAMDAEASVARKVLVAQAKTNLVDIDLVPREATGIQQIFNAAVEMKLAGKKETTAAVALSEKFNIPVTASVLIQKAAWRKVAAYGSNVYRLPKIAGEIWQTPRALEIAGQKVEANQTLMEVSPGVYGIYADPQQAMAGAAPIGQIKVDAGAMPISELIPFQEVQQGAEETGLTTPRQNAATSRPVNASKAVKAQVQQDLDAIAVRGASFGIQPLSPKAYSWLESNVTSDSIRWLGNTLVFDNEQELNNAVNQMVEEGLVVRK